MEESVQKKPRQYRRGLLFALIAVVIYAFGVRVGQGKVTVFNHSDTETTQNSKLPENLDYSSVENVYDTLKGHYDGELDTTKLLDGLKTGLAEATGDPYTEYMNATEAEQFNSDLNGTFTGIGAELGKEKDAIVIISPIAGFPAEKAGLKAKDIIVEINKESAVGMSVSDAVSKIRGPKDSEVTLKIIRNQTQEQTITIKRDTINIPSVKSETLDGNIGYIQISRYAEDTASLAHAAAAQFKAAGVKGVILDVRGDPGGLLDAAISVSSIWLPKDKTVLQEKRGDVVIKTYKASGSAELEGIPTVVLINGGSASASEITAGALKDNNVAQLIGEKSYGKGSVQQLERLIGGGVLKVTIARWYTPAGKNIDKEGISPDQEVKRTDEDLTANRDPQKDKALELLKK